MREGEARRSLPVFLVPGQWNGAAVYPTPEDELYRRYGNYGPDTAERRTEADDNDRGDDNVTFINRGLVANNNCMTHVVVTLSDHALISFGLSLEIPGIPKWG